MEPEGPAVVEQGVYREQCRPEAGRPKLTTSWMVASMGTEDGAKTTASQLGWTQEFDLPELGMSLLF